MAIKPTSLPRWATSASVVEPSLGKKAQGWLFGERVPAGMLNWIQRNFGEWIMWLMGGSRVLPWYQAVAIASTDGQYRALAFLDSVTTFTVMAIVTVASTSYVRVSTNAGLTWTNTTPGGGVPASSFSQGGLAANANRFVMVGSGIQTYEGGAWTVRSPAAGYAGGFSRVIWTGTQFVAVGNLEVQTSPDGITWTRRASTAPVGGPNTVNYLREVAHAGGRLVRVGASTAPGGLPNADVWYSDDGGTTWMFAYASVQAYLDKVVGTVFADGTVGFVASGESKACASAGGASWYDVVGVDAGDVCAFNDLLIAQYGARVSPDGLNWYPMPYSGYNQAISISGAAVSRAGFGLVIRPSSGSNYELARTAVQRWF